MSIVSKFLLKYPCCHAYISSHNRESSRNYTMLWTKKSIGCVFSISQEKFTSSMPIFCQEHVHSLKKILICIYFVRRTSILLKTLCSNVEFSMKKLILTCPYMVKETSILSKLNYIMSHKNQQDTLFSPRFHEKISTLMPIFCQKSLFAKKHATLMPLFC